MSLKLVLFSAQTSILVFLCLAAGQSEAQLEYRDIAIGRLGSRYWKQWNQAIISFDDAQQSCRSYGGSLAIFPAPNEANILWDLMAIDLKLNFNGEQNDIHFYWIGLKYETENKYWVNAENYFTIPNSKWSVYTPKYRLVENPSADDAGCIAVKMHWNATGMRVDGMLVHVACDESQGVRSYLCEKPDPNFPDFSFWETWSRWSNENCQGPDAVSSSRFRVCYGYQCELDALPMQTETKACCEVPPMTFPNGIIDQQFSINQQRAFENQSIELNCNNGFVHPVTRYHVSELICKPTTAGNLGVWEPAIPDQCSPVECGVPPLGVHAKPPMYTGTKYQDVAIYHCQTGFREPNDNETSVTLRCGNNDAWVGLDYNADTKAVCQPITNIVIAWEHFPFNEDFTSGNDNCYRLHHLGQTWEQALETCEGSLLYIDSDDEFEFLKTRILNPQAERSVLWLAGKKKATEISFNWYLASNRTTGISGYTNWESSGPYLAPYHRNLCIAANYSSGDWIWLNVTCDNKFEFVCKTLKQKTHGEWSEWTEWSSCNRQFIRERSHICNNPEPFCGGDDCVGSAMEQSHCCEDPGEGQYASITYRSITNDTVFLMPGHYFTYECQFGYEHLNRNKTMNITCLLNGTWSGPGTAPSCVAKRCPDPANGTRSTYIKTDPTKEYVHQSAISYDCEYGFVVAKNPSAGDVKQITCINGLWDQPPIDCYAKACAQPHSQLTTSEYDSRNINSVFVRHLNNKSHESWGWTSGDNDTDLYEDIYQYFCKTGYKVNDRIDYNITCTYNSNWKSSINTGLNLHPTSCEAVRCIGPPPQPITYSFWVNGTDPNNPAVRGKYLDRANYRCIDGYRVNTDIESDTRVLLTYSFTCGANNDWKDKYSPDSCKKQSCGDPGAGENIANRIGRSFLFGETVDYVCKTGYVYGTLITRRKVKCEKVAGSDYVRWNDSALNCTKVECGDPGEGSNVIKEGRIYEYGGIVTYSCMPQHVLLGGGLEKVWVRCTAQGTWNGTAPSCELAEIASDFAVKVVKPYAAEAEWIMSEKYDTIQTTFNVEFVGRPGYKTSNGSFSYITNVSEHTVHADMVKKTISDSGLIKVLILTRPEYIYQFKFHSVTRISSEMWPEDQPPLEIYTGGGLPFLGAVQEKNLPLIIPLNLLPLARKRPVATALGSSTAIGAKFDKRMFSEQNGTIIGFTVIVKEVHPYHVTEEVLAKEGYHDRYPALLLTWQQLDVYTDYKYITWPAYYAIPVCNVFDPSANCQKSMGPNPADSMRFNETNTDSELNSYRGSIYANLSSPDDSSRTEVFFEIGVAKGCEEQSRNSSCNGPLRRNRRFCVKLRAYTRYGWNDSMCSNWVAVEKQLEFDESLIVPTALAALPFIVFFVIMGGWTYRKLVKPKGIVEEEDWDYDNLEGELISTWTMGERPNFPTARRLALPHKESLSEAVKDKLTTTVVTNPSPTEPNSKKAKPAKKRRSNVTSKPKKL